MVEDNKKYEKMACRIVIVVLAVMFGLILNAFALAANDTSLGWVFFLAVPAGAVDVTMLLATFKLMYKLDKGEDI